VRIQVATDKAVAEAISTLKMNPNAHNLKKYMATITATLRSKNNEFKHSNRY
jgi:hypothetical protein